MITIYDNDKEDERVMLVFKDMKSMLSVYSSEKGRSYQTKVPKKEKTGVLAYKVVGGKTMVYYEEVNPKESNYKMEYKPYTFREFKELLREIQS